MIRSVFHTKHLDDILAAAADKASSLKRTLGPVQVTLLGVGAIIGTGIYATIGTATAGDAQRPGAGPSLMISFLITALVCAFTAFCYAEFASMVPIAGSAYTYSYATMGELVAWIIGWDLIIEYGIGNVAVAISWAGYFRSLMHDLGIDIPFWLATDYRTASAAGLLEKAPHFLGVPIVFNLLAAGITALITGFLVWGIKESARFNSAMVVLKIVVLVFFIGAGLYFVSPAKMAENWQPFRPNGWKGTLSGAAIVFFAFIGFDAVSTVAEETKRPGRDLPIGILASLAICTIFYVAIAAVFSGMIPFPEIVARPDGRAESLTMALKYVAPDAKLPRIIVGFGSVVAQTAVLLVFLMGQPRIFFSMARDGLLPQVFAKLHPKFQTPYVATIMTGVVVGILSSLANIDEMVDLTNIGTLFAFVLVCVGIPILRARDPGRERPFRVPFGAYPLPMLGAASCLFLMFYLPPASWWRFVGWLALGLAIYTSYGFTRSVVGRGHGRPERTPWSLKVAAVGFLTLAVGLFVVPHHTESHPLSDARFVTGLVLIGVGLAVGAAGTYLASTILERGKPVAPDEGGPEVGDS